MTDQEFKHFMAWLMCSDPWPVEGDDASRDAMIALADREAKKRGQENWIVAFHDWEPFDTGEPFGRVEGGE